MSTPLPPTLQEQHARFHELVIPNLEPLLRFAQRRVQDDGDAEDAVQEACIRAWVAFDDLRDATKVRAWLYRILRGVISDAIERQDRRRQLVSISRLEDVHESLMGSEPDFVFSEVAARLDGEMLRTALSMIPEDFAVAVELHDIDGLKYHEIAEIVGVPVGTVMSRMSRGRRLLAATIAEHRHAWSLADASTTTRGARARRFGGRGAS